MQQHSPTSCQECTKAYSRGYETGKAAAGENPKTVEKAVLAQRERSAKVADELAARYEVFGQTTEQRIAAFVAWRIRESR